MFAGGEVWDEGEQRLPSISMVRLRSSPHSEPPGRRVRNEIVNDRKE